MKRIKLVPFVHKGLIHTDVEAPEQNYIQDRKELWIGTAPLRMSIEEDLMYMEYEIENLITDVWSNHNRLRVRK